MADYDEESSSLVLDYTDNGLKTIELPNNVDPIGLICDHNDLTKIDHLENHQSLKQVSLACNHIVRMNGISVLKHLQVLDLANNSIVNIEGLEGLSELTWLDLSGNSIKTLSHLTHNTQLHHLDLSDNCIGAITDLSPLNHLQALLLHGNTITSLKPVPSCLPHQLRILSLESNELQDLTEISYLSSLESLEQLSIARNPCVHFTSKIFDYRPYIINWCFSLQFLDGARVTNNERLLGEWLYSQGEGRHFKPGEHQQLVSYLASNPSLSTSQQLRSEEDAKLSRILHKQRLHHDQLVQQHQHRPSSREYKTLVNRTLSQPHGKSETNSITLDTSNQQHQTEKTTFPKSAWTSQETKITNRPRTEPNTDPTEGQTALLHDVSIEDYEVRSNVSLLDSESVYLPLDGSKLPPTPTRPMTAPAQDSNRNAFTFTGQERPQTGQERLSDRHSESRYEAYDRRPIKPLNQNLARSGKRNFEFSPPQPSGSGPAIGVKKPAQPTAVSQDYDTSMDQNNSDQENMEMDPIPSGGLSLIKDVVGTRRAQQVLNRQNNNNDLNKNHRKNSGKTAEKVSKPQSSYKVSSQHAEKVSNPQSGYKVSNPQSSYKSSNPNPNAEKVSKPQSSYNAEKYFSTLSSTGLSNITSATNNRAKDSKKGPILQDSGYCTAPTSGVVLDKMSSTMEEQKAAIRIQAFWKGHRSRQYDVEVVSVRNEIRARHAEQHIIQLKEELERQKKICDDEKKFRDLQMEAIRSLHNEVKSLQNWKNEVLSSQSVGESEDSNKLTLTGGIKPSLTGTADSSVTALLSRVQHHEQQNLEETCASLQSQVLYLQETLESLQSTGSTILPDFDETDLTSDIQVLTNFDVEELNQTSPTSERWSSIPHSLSPYPSEEEDQYFQQVPDFGVPTPPRALKLQHKGSQSLVLSWQRSRLLDASGKTQNKNIIGYRVYVNDHCQAMVRYYKTRVLITGLSPHTIYKFYVKALSGLGESYESNIIMAKLALTQSTRSIQSSESDSPDSEKEQSSASHNGHASKKHSKRRIRKERSPRSSRSQKTFTVPAKTELDDSSIGTASLLTQPRLHKHRRTPSNEHHQHQHQSNEHHQHQINIHQHQSNDHHHQHQSIHHHQSDRSDNTDSEKRLSTGSERSANISSTSHRTDSSIASPGQDLSSVESRTTVVESGRGKYFKSLNDSPGEKDFKSPNESPEGKDFKSPNDSSEGKYFKSPNESPSTGMSETFTVEKSRSFLLSLGKNNSFEENSNGKSRARSRSKDREVKEGSSESRRTPSTDTSPTEKITPEIIKTHRRKRSKDLKNPQGDFVADSESSQSENRGLPAGVPVIDGRKRHSSGSRSNSPMLESMDTNTSERKRVPVADLLEQRFHNIHRTSTPTSQDDLQDNVFVHRQLPPSPKSKGQRSSSPQGSSEDIPGSTRRRTISSGSDDANNSSTSSRHSVVNSAAKVLQKLQSLSKTHEKKLRKKSQERGGEERKEGRVRRVSESDCDTDTGGSTPSRRQAPAPSDTSGSHSDDTSNKSHKSHLKHRRTPSDQSGVMSFIPNIPVDRPTHSPIIMEGGNAKKTSSSSSSSNVKRHSSFHGLLPPKHQDKSTSREDLSKPAEESEQSVSKEPAKKSPNFRSRSPSPVSNLLSKPVKAPSQQGRKSKFFSDILS